MFSSLQSLSNQPPICKIQTIYQSHPYLSIGADFLILLSLGGIINLAHNFGDEFQTVYCVLFLPGVLAADLFVERSQKGTEGLVEADARVRSIIEAFHLSKSCGSGVIFAILRGKRVRSL